jgi:hypothetical protein
VVHAVDPDLAVAIDPLHDRAGLDDERVAVGQVGRVLVGDRLGHVLGEVEEQRAPLGDVEQLHPAADGEHRHVPRADVLDQQAVEVLAAGVHRPNRRVRHVAIAAGIEVGPAHEHDAVEEVEQPDEIFLGRQRGQDHRNPAAGGDPVEVTRGHERQGGVLLAGGAVVGVDADEGLGGHGSS